MKKLISALFTMILSLSICMTAYAESGSKTFDSLPKTVDVPVVISANVWYNAGTVKDGSVTVKGSGITASSDKVPAGAVRLVVVPITDDEALAWFNGCIGEHWSVTGTIYAVYYEDANGNRMDATGVKMSVEIPNSYGNLNVYSLDTDETSDVLDSRAIGTTVSFETDGRLYYGVVHSRGVIHEEAEIKPGAPKAELNMTQDEIINAVFSEEDKKYLDNGIDAHVKLTVEDITDKVTQAEKQAVESVSNGYKVGMYVDVKLQQKIGDRSWTDIHETKEPIRITLTIPDNLIKPGRVFAVVRVHNGKGEFMTDLDNDPATITFETTEFSTYAILYRDTITTSNNPSNGDNSGSDSTASNNIENVDNRQPKTTKSDNSGDKGSKGSSSSSSNNSETGNNSLIDLWILIAGISAISFVCVSFYSRRRKREEK